VHRLAIVIPALDCEGTIADVVRGGLGILDTVVVIDDGSTDATADRAGAAGAIVIRHDRTRGKGAALVSGIQWAARGGFTHVVTMDGDGQHIATEIPKLLELSRQYGDALVIGARDAQSTNPARLRLFGNRFANRWVEIASGLALPDTQSGFRVYPVAQTAALGVRARHFAFETEVLIRAARAGIPIESVPVTVYYPPPGQWKSHYRGFVDTVRIIFVVLGLIFRLW
jgi:glycosyltransferase involved in cell wall biosynthesis